MCYRVNCQPSPNTTTRRSYRQEMLCLQRGWGWEDTEAPMGNTKPRLDAEEHKAVRGKAEANPRSQAEGQQCNCTCSGGEWEGVSQLVLACGELSGSVRDREGALSWFYQGKLSASVQICSLS